MSTLVLIAGVLSFSIGIAVFWANPSRFTNQVFAGTAVLVTAHTFCIYYAVQAGLHFAYDHTSSPVPMLRASAAILALFPWLLWIQKESLASKEDDRYLIIIRSLPWLILGILLGVLGFTDWYIPSDSLPTNERHGPAYPLVSITMIAAFTFLIGQSWYELRRQPGIRRIEMQFLVFNSSIAALLGFGLGFAGNFIEVPALRRFGLLTIIAVYAMAAMAVTYYRIYDIRQMLVSLTHWAGLVILLVSGILLEGVGLDIFLPHVTAYVLSIAIFSSIAFWLERRTRSWLGIDGERALAEMRIAVIEIARSEPEPEKLEDEYEKFLAKQCHTPSAIILLDQGGVYAARNLEFSKIRLGCVALGESGWATPESITRRRATPGLADLRSFLIDHSLGVMVAAPRGSQSPSLVIALGIKHNEWPFTYPEVQRLQNIAELMDNILTRSRLTMQAAERAKMEHLAMMSRGLAHDLNNLITPISSFLVHTDERFALGSAERQVHDAAQRSVRVMTDYVREALFFSDRFTARFEPVDLDRIFHEVRALTATRAGERGVTVVGTTEYYGKFTADAVLLQRMLVNVVSNAIDASTPGQTVALSAAPGRSGCLGLRVVDGGCGISPEDLERIFDPYFTTKRYGDEVRGFGLGLTTCQKIAHLHGGTISVNSQPGCGTTVTIDLPIAQSS